MLSSLFNLLELELVFDANAVRGTRKPSAAVINSGLQ
jgi:hypothetical protein